MRATGKLIQLLYILACKESIGLNGLIPIFALRYILSIHARTREGALGVLLYNAPYMQDTGEQIAIVEIDTASYEDDVQPTEAYSHFLETKPWLFKPGVSGNPSGRRPGKSMKEWMKEYLANLTDTERLDFFRGIPKVDLWRMAEGNPTEDRTIKVSVPQPILGGISQAPSMQGLEETNTQHIGPTTGAAVLDEAGGA